MRSWGQWATTTSFVCRNWTLMGDWSTRWTASSGALTSSVPLRTLGCKTSYPILSFIALTMALAISWY